MKLSKVPLFQFFIIIISWSNWACADWDLDSLQTAGGNCLIRERRIDETKLQLKFYEFSASLSHAGVASNVVRETCTLKVEFRIPARHRLKTLTHRVQATAKKDPWAELKILTAVGIGGLQFRQAGQLPLGTNFDGRLLLYKSFPVSVAVGCESFEQKISVTSEIVLELISEISNRSADVFVTGDDEGADLWLETEPC